jgi:hypothetical protein
VGTDVDTLADEIDNYRFVKKIVGGIYPKQVIYA